MANDLVNSVLLVVLLSTANQCEGRKSRALTFLPTTPTRIQFIGGIGIPVEDLNFESVTSGYVLKAEYFLPERADQFRPNYLKPINIHGRTFGEDFYDPLLVQNVTTVRHIDAPAVRREAVVNVSSQYVDNFNSQQKNASVYRWIIYSGIETLLSRAGLPGRTCLLRSICEHAALPLHYGSGMLAEILHIVLTPSASHDDFSRTSDKAYLMAEILGRKGHDCEGHFSTCTKSLMDQISAVFDLEE